MAKTVTAKRAEAALAAIREQFKSYLSGMGENEGPKLIKDYESYYGGTIPFVIYWEDYAPYDWAINAGPSGGIDEEMSEAFGKTVEIAPAANWPKGVWAEAVNGYVLALYPED
jgi:hypothetical protein